MIKVARSGNKILLLNPNIPDNFFEINKTSWEIIKAVKEFGEEKAVEIIAGMFSISKEIAKKDVKTVIDQLASNDIFIKDIPQELPDDLLYYPRAVSFEITSRCNSNCIYCLADERIKTSKDIPTQKVKEILNELDMLGTWFLLLTGGEPFLRDDIYEIVAHTEKHNFQTQIFTNGMLIDEKTAEKCSKYKNISFQVSLDSANSKHHEYNRGLDGSFDKAVQGIKNLTKYGLTPRIATVVTPKNFDDMEANAEFLHSLGVDFVRITPVTCIGKAVKNKEKVFLNFDKLKELGEIIIEINKKYGEELVFQVTPHMLQLDPDSPHLEKWNKKKMCGLGRSILHITSNGFAYPCILFVDDEFLLGDLKKEKLTDIWNNSPILKEIRELNVDNFEKCGECDIRYYCGGGCRGNAYAQYKSLTKYDPIYCSFFKK